MKGDQAEGQPGTPGHKVQGFISAPLIVTKLTQLLTVNVTHTEKTGVFYTITLY